MDSKRDISTLVERAATHARDGQGALAIAAIDEALGDRLLGGSTRLFLEYLRSLATADGSSGADLWPSPEIGDDVVDPDVELGLNHLRRWAEACWVTAERVDRLRAACAKEWSIKAPQLAVALAAQAGNLARRGSFGEAAAACRESVALWRDDDFLGGFGSRRGEALRLLGAIECSIESFKAASAASAEACRIFRALARGGRERYLEPWASASHNLAGARLNEGDVGGAVAAIRAAATMRQELAQAWPSLFRKDLVESLVEASRILNEADLGEEAFATSQRAITLTRGWINVGRADHSGMLARALQNHARSALSIKDWRAGLDAVDAEIALIRELFGDRDTQWLLVQARALHNRATFLTLMERDREAIASLNDSIQMHEGLREKPEGAAELLGGSLHLAGSLAARAGDLESSERWFRRAVELRVAQRARSERLAEGNIAQSSIEWANASERLGRTENVAVATQSAVVALSALAKEEASAFNLTRLAHGFLQLGNVRRRLGDLDAAIAAYRSAAALKRGLEEARADGALSITAARKLVVCLKRAGRTEESEAWRQRFGITDKR